MYVRYSYHSEGCCGPCSSNNAILLHLNIRVIVVVTKLNKERVVAVMVVVITKLNKERVVVVVVVMQMNNQSSNSSSTPKQNEREGEQ